MSKSKKKNNFVTNNDYSILVTDINGVLENARKFSARAVNSILTSTYWLIGRRIVEYEFQGMDRSEYYGDKLLENLSIDLQKKFGRGFSRQNIQLMKQFYETYLFEKISQTLSNKSLAADNIPQAPSAQSLLIELSNKFPLSWSHYVRLLSVKNEEAGKFYETESLRCGWSVRQLDRQISSQFYERTLLSKNKAAMLKKGERPLAQDVVTAEEEIKDPFVLEFLGLNDEYSENDLEEALINHLEKFLLELGSNFAFIGKQKRLRIGSVWYRVDLIFFHRKLKCLVVINLKVGKFTHAERDKCTHTSIMLKSIGQTKMKIRPLV